MALSPLSALKAAVAEFEKRRLAYCLIGGHAASLYREIERVTKDVDFALIGDPKDQSQKQAEEVIKAIGLKPVIGFIPDQSRPNKKGSAKMVSSKPVSGSFSGIIDIFLPSLPWLEDAVARAQFNKIDLIFAEVPVITPEDLIVAKCYALQDNPERFQDLDDIKEIIKSLKNLDSEYLSLKLKKHRLSLPRDFKLR